MRLGQTLVVLIKETASVYVFLNNYNTSYIVDEVNCQSLIENNSECSNCISINIPWFRNKKNYVNEYKSLYGTSSTLLGLIVRKIRLFPLNSGRRCRSLPNHAKLDFGFFQRQLNGKKAKEKESKEKKTQRTEIKKRRKGKMLLRVRFEPTTRSPGSWAKLMRLKTLGQSILHTLYVNCNFHHIQQNPWVYADTPGRTSLW